MPVIAMFYGIIIMMYAGNREHNPPHFHAKYAEFEAEYDFDGNVLQGELPRMQHRLVMAWAEIHSDDLAADWELCSKGLSPIKIDALRL